MSARMRLPLAPQHAGTLTNRPTVNRAPHAPWLAVGGLMLAVAVLYLWQQIVTPFDGARVAPGSVGFTTSGLEVAPLTPGIGPWRDGDVVVAVEGHPVAELAAALFDTSAPRLTLRHGDTLRYSIERAGRLLELEVAQGAYPLAKVARSNWGTIVFALVYLLVAGFVYTRRPNVPATRPFFLSACALLAATTWSLGLRLGDVIGGVGFWLYQAGAGLGFMLFWSAGLHFALLFPKPLPLAGRPWLPWLVYGLPYLVLGLHVLAQGALVDDTLAWLATWSRAVDVHAAFALTLTLLAFGVQYRSQRDDAAGRRQIRWVVFAALLAGGAGLMLYLLPPLLGLGALHSNAIGAIVCVFPLAIAVAVLRHNLFDIDRLVSHALVYGGLSAGVVGVYVTLVAGVGRLLSVADDRWLSLLATAIVALAFQPLRSRWQRTVDRALFGQRDQPVQLLDRLGERLEAIAEPDRLLPTLVETVAEALKLPYVAVVLHEGEALTVAAEYGRPLPAGLELPLVDRGTVMGALVVAARDTGSDLAGPDRELLATIARQAGSAVRAVRLMGDLQRSRLQLVTLREEERRRLRRDLHDGLGPTLAAMALRLDAARNLVRGSPAHAETQLESLANQLHDSIDEVRRLVLGLRPPALDELGLVGALREHARRLDHAGLRIELDVPDRLPRLSAAVEVAAYRIALEALTNVVRHADARRCRVSLELETDLELLVADDGIGVGHGAVAGVGLRSMRERAEELGGRFEVLPAPGGGTRVRARLPLEEERS